jgi:hypothetical protein
MKTSALAGADSPGVTLTILSPSTRISALRIGVSLLPSINCPARIAIFFGADAGEDSCCAKTQTAESTMAETATKALRRWGMIDLMRERSIGNAASLTEERVVGPSPRMRFLATFSARLPRGSLFRHPLCLLCFHDDWLFAARWMKHYCELLAAIDSRPTVVMSNVVLPRE